MTFGRTAVGMTCALLLSGIALTAAHAQVRAGLPPPGASSCSGCHPVSSTVDTPVVRLIGRYPAEIVSAVQAFRSGQRPATVMDRIAKGFTDDEIKAIADWYGAQRN
jgi:cytochrome c553